MEHDTRKFRGPKQRGRAAEPGRIAKPRKPGGNGAAESPAVAALAAVIAEVLPQYRADAPPEPSAELYADLFIDSRRFLMIVRGLERTLGIEIDDEDLLGVDLITYGDLVKFVSGIPARKSGMSNV